MHLYHTVSDVNESLYKLFYVSVRQSIKNNEITTHTQMVTELKASTHIADSAGIHCKMSDS